MSGMPCLPHVLTQILSPIAPLTRELSPRHCPTEESQTLLPGSLWKLQHRAQVRLWAGGASPAGQQAQASWGFLGPSSQLPWPSTLVPGTHQSPGGRGSHRTGQSPKELDGQASSPVASHGFQDPGPVCCLSVDSRLSEGRY